MDKERYDVRVMDFEDERTMRQTLALLREVFGHDSFTVDWWKWKYLGSPFGKAVGWCVVDRHTDVIVSVRIVWRWRLVKKGVTSEAYQMVDTATAASHRGLGFFRELTHQALLFIGNKPIFNFPNSNSAPLDKKMGWRELCNQPWLLCFSCYFPRLSYREGELDARSEMPQEFFFCVKKDKSVWQTNWTVESLVWRFAKHPHIRYKYFVCGEGRIIYRVDRMKCIRIATIVYVCNSNRTMYNQFSSFLFRKGIWAFRYNAYHDVDYDMLHRSRRCISVKKQFKYFSRNDLDEMTLTTGDTDVL